MLSKICVIMGLTRSRCHIFYTQRVVDIPDGKDKWTKLDKDSELMKDMK